MAKTYHRLELDVNKKPNSIGIRPVQSDTKSRYLDVCLYENGVPINLTGEQVRITFRKADGSTFFNQGEVTDAKVGRCQFALTNEILSEAKAVEAQISVWNKGSQVLSAEIFTIYVSKAIPWTDAVESENEYGVLVVLFQEIQDALDTMHKIATTFGEPGDKAAEYGVDTFWGILEILAQRGDVESATEKIMDQKVKAYLNSTIGTGNFQTLDKMIQTHGTQTFTSNGIFTVPAGVTKILVTACGGGAGGGGAGWECTGAGGNGGACIIREPFSVTPGQTIGIIIGIGGAGGSNGTSSYGGDSGKAGTATIIGSLVTLPGGDAGNTYWAPGLNANVGAGRGGCGRYPSSNFSISSEDGGKGARGTGGFGTYFYPDKPIGGGGGGSYGNGGSGAYDSSPATKPGYGGGGGGGNVTSSSSGPSDGGNGIVIIEW